MNLSILDSEDLKGLVIKLESFPKLEKENFTKNLPLLGKEKLQQQLKDKRKEESLAKCRL